MVVQLGLWRRKMKSRLLGAMCAMLFVSIMPLYEVQASFLPISSNLSINGDSNLESNLDNPGTSISDSQGTTNNPLNVSYNRTLNNGVETLTETGTASANWSDPSSGSVMFDLDLSSGNLFGANLGFSFFDTGFVYTFTAETDGLLTFGGSVSGWSSAGLQITSSVLFGSILSRDILRPSGPTSLFLTDNLVAGQDYRLSFDPFMGVSCATVVSTGQTDECDLSDRNLTLIADLTFDFQPVPIPAALYLFGSGLLGLIGISRRKK